MLGDRTFNLIVSDHSCTELVAAKSTRVAGRIICSLLMTWGQSGDCDVNRCGEERRGLVRRKEPPGGLCLRKVIPQKVWHLLCQQPYIFKKKLKTKSNLYKSLILFRLVCRPQQRKPQTGGRGSHH